MKIFTFSLCIWASLALADNTPAPNQHPCKDKREAKQAAHKAVHMCLMEWAKDHHPSDPDPSDDCSAKLQLFIQAAKDVKACVAQNKLKQ